MPDDVRHDSAILLVNEELAILQHFIAIEALSHIKASHDVIGATGFLRHWLYYYLRRFLTLFSVFLSKSHTDYSLAFWSPGIPFDLETGDDWETPAKI
jgi:hypothetical protein